MIPSAASRLWKRSLSVCLKNKNMPVHEPKPTGIPWEIIFKTLEKWHNRISAKDETAVGQVAEKYRQEPDGPWAVLVSTILSLRTKDEVTRNTSRALLAKAPDPVKLLRLTEEEVSRLAYPAGFYRTKASQLRKIASILIIKYNSKVPADMEALLELPGVGRKTANLVLTEAFDMYGICVDIHVHRICNRTGWIKTTSPDETETTLRAILPKKFWKKINGLLVFYGQNICRPVSPFCSLCVIYEHCVRAGVDKSR